MDCKLIAMAAHLLSDVHRGPINCLDVRVDLPPLGNAGRNILRSAAEALFWELPPVPKETRGRRKRVLQSTATRPARRMKSAEDIEAAMHELFERRRKEEPGDCTPIYSSDTRARIWNEWCDDFLDKELNAEQRGYTRSGQTSIFTAYIKNRYGAKAFVFALLQTGMSWKPPDPSIFTFGVQKLTRRCYRARSQGS